MKKVLLIAFVFFNSIIGIVYAQNDPSDNGNKRQEKIKVLYVAYLTQELNLTAEEAQKFWPLHTQFENELKAVKTDMPELEKQQTILNIKKKYQDNFNRILGANRCERFFRINVEFKQKLLDRIRKQHMDQRPGMKRGQ